MKKLIAIALAGVLVLALAACGGGTDTPANTDTGSTTPDTNPANTTPEDNTPADTTPADNTPADSTPADTTPADTTPADTTPAEAGQIVIKESEAAIVVNGTAVPMPYRFMDLVNAGVPADTDTKDATLGAGDFWTLNMYLDENEDYVVMPAYYNGGDETITIENAGAEEISMVTYFGEPVDQGVSILGVTFGMNKADIKAKLGEPMEDSGDYLYWEVKVPGTEYEGSFTIYLTDAEGGASNVTLSLQKW